MCPPGRRPAAASATAPRIALLGSPPPPGSKAGARAAGLTTRSILARHIVPNLLGPVVVYVTLTIPAVILAESFLSFLGMGVQEPLTSLGTLISNGNQDRDLAPWLLIFPSVVMVTTLMAFNFIGDGLRDAIDPKDR